MSIISIRKSNLLTIVAASLMLSLSPSLRAAVILTENFEGVTPPALPASLTNNYVYGSGSSQVSETIASGYLGTQSGQQVSTFGGTGQGAGWEFTFTNPFTSTVLASDIQISFTLAGSQANGVYFYFGKVGTAGGATQVIPTGTLGDYTVYSYTFDQWSNPLNVETGGNLRFGFEMNSNSWGGAGAGKTVQIDNIQISAVPEPSTVSFFLILGAFGATVAFYRRLKKA